MTGDERAARTTRSNARLVLRPVIEDHGIMELQLHFRRS